MQPNCNWIAGKLTILAVPPVWLILYFLSQLLGGLVITRFEQGSTEGFLSSKSLLNGNVLRQLYFYKRAYTRSGQVHVHKTRGRK